MISKTVTCLASACALVLALPAIAGAFPDEPIMMVVPYPPGGPNDILARAINGPLGQALGQPVVIDNRGGAGGNVGTEYVIGSRNDGHTLLFHGMAVAVNASLYRQADYDPVNDLETISIVAETPLVLVVPASLPIDNVAELIDYAKEHPGELNYGSGGAGTSLHLGAIRFMDVAGLQMEHIPYQGNAHVIPDLISGLVDVLFSSIPTALPHIESGDLKALGVTTRERSSVLPDVPTIAEAGLPDFEFGAWYGILAPAGTPDNVRQAINGAVEAVLEDPDVERQLTSLAAQPVIWSVDQASTFVAEEYEDWRKIIEEAGLTID